MIANITEILAIYASQAAGLQKELAADGKDIVKNRANHHNQEIKELIMKLLPESNKLWDLVRNNERKFGASSPECKQATEKAQFMEECLQLAYELYVNV